MQKCKDRREIVISSLGHSKSVEAREINKIGATKKIIWLCGTRVYIEFRGIKITYWIK